jgi:hypothetical protein
MELLMWVKRGVGLLVGLVGLLACVLAIANGVGIEHTISNAQRLDKQFRQTATAIENFKRSTNRLPTPKELSSLLPQQARNAYEVIVIPNGFGQCDDKSDDYMRVSPGEYVLVTWRGEWYECFVPSTQKSTLALNESDLTLTGSIGSDRLAFAAIALVSFFSAAFLWLKFKQSDLVAPRENGEDC